MPDLRHQAIITAAKEAANAEADAAAALSREEEEERYPWPAKAWNSPPPKLAPLRYPVLLTPGGPISSASKLQKLAETESLPEAIETSQVDDDDSNREIKKVTICNVSHNELKKMMEKAELSHGMEENVTVVFNGAMRFAWAVKALKEGVTLGDEDEDEERSLAT
ncbi:hypothetical protein C8A00DRAFT_15312 [Chaetomidium leptoderma]|uniref:Uncharacterized protein n=1 Tax=Chaetomidium leptoderma TaxID=669021 RepID=A0AAN6VLH1_9PEZI|nr:hypothetical protein C8A00DRAFT_15312 [Chaetomidium leptoderma]